MSAVTDASAHFGGQDALDVRCAHRHRLRHILVRFLDDVWKRELVAVA
jgi:hypothetical protein